MILAGWPIFSDGRMESPFRQLGDKGGFLIADEASYLLIQTGFFLRGGGGKILVPGWAIWRAQGDSNPRPTDSEFYPVKF